MEAGLLIIHLVVGSLFAIHGYSKLTNLDFQAGYMESVGMYPGRLMAFAAGATELAAGVALAAGFATPFAAAGAAAVMLVAARTDHRGKGLWIYTGGAEYVVTNAAVVLGLAFNGAGKWSVDHALGWDVNGVVWGSAALVAAVVGGLSILALGRLGARSTAGAVTA